MDSIFSLSPEEKKKKELDNIDFNNLVEQQIKKCNFSEDLELLLYDIVDAIQKNQILLVEASNNREEAYLIPIILAYQNTSFFNSFIIATASQKTRRNIIKKLKQLSSLLETDIPIHELKEEESYLCLRKLKSYNQKVTDPIVVNPLPTQATVSKEEWQKIHVKNCLLGDCKFFKNCPYVLDYNAYKNGCLIVSQSALIGNHKYNPRRDIYDNANFVLIDEASKLPANIKSYHQGQLDYNHILKYFVNTRKLLFKVENAHFDDRHLQNLQTFFEIIVEYAGKKNWKPDDRIQQMAKEIADTAKDYHIHLTRRYAFVKMNRSIEYLCELLFSIEKVFEDIASNGKKFIYQIQSKIEEGMIPNFQKIQIHYYPKMVDEIIASSLGKMKESIAFTDGNIAEADNSYQKLCKECGIEKINKEIVKEYSLKK